MLTYGARVVVQDVRVFHAALSLRRPHLAHYARACHAGAHVYSRLLTGIGELEMHLNRNVSAHCVRETESARSAQKNFIKFSGVFYFIC